MMRTLMLSIGLLVWQPCFCQIKYSPEQLDRLADAGKVYGYIKYFHPFLQYRNLNWDSTFAANVPAILATKNREEYAVAMQNLLAPLNDNLTTVLNIHPDKNYHVKTTAYQIKDSILYIEMNDITWDHHVTNDTYNIAESYGIVQKALQQTNKVKGIVLDMRKPPNSVRRRTEDLSGGLIDGSNGLFKGVAAIPGFRSVGYEGLPPDDIPETNDQVFFRQTLGRPVKGTALKDIPMVFIADNGEQAPLVCYALQQQGKAAVIQLEGKDLVLGRSISFYICDSLVIRMRTSEAVNQDGSLAIIHSAINSSIDPDSAMVTAKKLILNGIPAHPASGVLAPQPTSHPVDYSQISSFPALGYRVLAAAKVFSVIDNFLPIKKLLDKNWEQSYRETISKFIGARDSLEYIRAVAELYTNINDSHGFITKGNSFSLKLNPIIQGRGTYTPPVIIRLIENKVVVTDIYKDTICRSAGIKKGDIILSIDDKDPLQEIEILRKYQPASNKATQTFFICNFLLFGEKGQLRKLRVQGANGKVRGVSLPVVGELNGDFFSDPYISRIYQRHLAATFKFLSKDIGYADFTSPLQEKDVDSLFTLFKNTKTVIIDIRGYPRTFAFLPKYLLKDPEKLFGKFNHPSPSLPDVDDLTNENSNQEMFKTGYQKLSKYMELFPGRSVYPGHIVMLMDESDQSAAEFACFTAKIACNATLIGSHTAGANAYLTRFHIPGGITLWFGAIAVNYPDGKPTERVGIQPDITVYPTIKGIQAGKDEVLDRAIKFADSGQ